MSALLIAAPQHEAGIIETGLRDIACFLGADRAVLWQWDGASRRYRRAHHWFADGLPGTDQWSSVELPWIGARLNADGLVRFARTDELPAEARADRQAMRDLGVLSLLAVPLRVAGREVGVFTVAAVQRECDWPDELLPGVRLLAEVFAALQMRRRTEARERAAADRRQKRLAEDIIEDISGVKDVSNRLKVRFTEYDWSLNDTPKP